MRPLLLLFTFWTSFDQLNAARLLFITFPNSKSHRGSLYPFAKKLAQIGHEVTLWSESVSNADKPDSPPGVDLVFSHVANVSQEQVDGFVNYNTSLLRTMLWLGKPNPVQYGIMYNLCAEVCRQLLSQDMAGFQAIVRKDWDMILLDPLFTNCGHAIVALNPHVPLALVHTSLIESWVRYARSSGPSPVVSTPLLPGLSWSHTLFMDRLRSSIESFSTAILFYTLNEYFVRSSTAAAVQGVSMWEHFRNAEITFFEYPPLLDIPKPMTRETIDAGSHCTSTKPEPLSAELEAFVSVPTSKGTILVAFGTIAKIHTAPLHVQATFIEALRSLSEYRIIWQFTGNDFPPMPPHVKILRWVPQYDILSHPTTKLFLTHGGLKSFKESVCTETPLLLLPLFAEQYMNAVRSAALGIGKSLDKMELHSDVIASAVREITENPSYAERVLALQKQMNDRILPALEESAFWVDYILRRKGAPNLWKRRSHQLFWFQYWCFDVIAVMVACFLITSAVAGRVLMCLLWSKQN